MACYFRGEPSRRWCRASGGESEMGRVSRAVADRHHQELIEAASRLFRERDLGEVSVPDVMGEIGLTRGGFYKHFESKDALVTAAVEHTFHEHFERIATFADEADQDLPRALRNFVEFCLSDDHRDNPGAGCPASLASGISRCDEEGDARAAYVVGTEGVIERLLELLPPEGDKAEQRQQVLLDLSTIAGALLLSRATAGYVLSDEILAAVRARFAR